MMDKTTMRLVIPDWQAGNNPVYSLGARILAAIAPDAPGQITVTVPMDEAAGPKRNNVNSQEIIRKNLLKTKQAISEQAPDRIIALGGNCLVSQAPIDYLNARYSERLGVVWIDAHPDISTPDVFDNEHAMVVANLLHRGDPVFNRLVDHPLVPEQVFYAGLQTPTQKEQDLLRRAGVEFAGHQRLSVPSMKEWSEHNGFDHVYLHLDIDVLGPTAFYATYLNNPKLGDIPENAAKGAAGLSGLFDFIRTIDRDCDVVGMTIAEYMPWSAEQLSSLMGSLRLFRQ